MMSDVQEFIEKIRDFLRGYGKKALLICVLLIFMTLCALIVLILQKSCGIRKSAPETQRKLVLEQDLLVPPGPAVPDEYVTSRKTPDKWSGDDAEKWFTLPDSSEIKELGRVNDRIIDDIVEAAP